MTEVSNEIFILVLITLLINFYNDSKWTRIAENLFIGVILSQLLILVIVSVVSSTITLVRFIIKTCKERHNKSNLDLQSEKASEHDSNDSKNSNSENVNVDQIGPIASQNSNLDISNVEKSQNMTDKDEEESQKLDNYVIM